MYFNLISYNLLSYLCRIYVTSVSIGENVAGGLIIGLGVVIVIIAVTGCLVAAREYSRGLLVVGGTSPETVYG